MHALFSFGDSYNYVFKVEVMFVLHIISAHILSGPHDGILKISIEYGMHIQSNSNMNVWLSVQSWKLLKQHGGVGAHRKELLAAKCKALGLFQQKRVKQNKNNIFLKNMRQKYICMMINSDAGDSKETIWILDYLN